MKPGWMRAKALGVVARGRSVECELGAWGLKGTGYRVTENRDGLCISICMARWSPISTVYLRLNRTVNGLQHYYRWYRLADINRAHALYKQ